MTYTAKNANQLRGAKGTQAEILAREFGLIDTEIDSVKSAATTLTSTVGGHTTSIGTINTSLAAGVKVAKIYSPGAAMNAFSFNWQNPETSKIIIYKAILHVYDNETVGTGAVMNIGVASGTGVEGDNLLDGVSIETIGLFDNVTNKGDNGLPQVVVDEKDGTNDWVTGKVITATGASYSGYLYLFYVTVGANTV